MRERKKSTQKRVEGLANNREALSTAAERESDRSIPAGMTVIQVFQDLKSLISEGRKDFKVH